MRFNRACLNENVLKKGRQMSLDKKYNTGILWQDFQHKKLIDLTESLNKSKADGYDSNTFSYAFGFLVMYVTDHFTLEEEYMKKYNYQDSEYHILEHQNFINIVKEMRQKHTEPTEESLEILVKHISDWIKTHIMHNDKILGEFIISRGKSNI